MISQNLTDVAAGLERLFERAPALVVLLSGPEHRFAFANTAYRDLIGSDDIIGRTVVEALPELSDQGFVDLLDQVYRTGELYKAEGALARLRRGLDVEELYFDFVYQPVFDTAGKVLGIFGQGADVTARVLAEAAARNSQATLNLATQASQLGIWDLQIVSGAMDASTRAREIWDLPTEGPITQDEVFAKIHPDDADAVKAQFWRATDPKVRDRSPYQYRIRTQEGVRWARAQAEAVFEDRLGEPVAVRCVGTLEDITADREREHALRDSEARLRLAIDAGRMAVWGIDANGAVQSSPELNRLLGLPPEARPTLAELQERYYPGELERLQELGQKVMEAGERFFEFEYRHRLPNDDVRWLAVRAELLQDDVGASAGSLGVVVDITERKAAELALEQLNETLESRIAERTAERDRMWRLSAELMLVADNDGLIHAVNPAWTHALGYEPPELIGTNFLDLVHPEDVAATLAEVARLEQGATTFSFENRYRGKDGSFRCLSWTAVPEEGFIHAVARDVTREKAAAAALRQTEEALRQSQKMEAVGQLTGGIAHDFNNMLAVVIGSLDLLSRRLDPADARSQRYVGSAMDGARRAALLTQRLLAFSRQQPLRPEAVDINKLVAGMSELLRHSLGGAVRLETILAGGLWRTKVDPNQLENVILNLAVNARDAMPEGGKLTVETQNAHLDDRYASAHLGVHAGHYLLIAVSDTGEGMAPEVVAKAFDPFYTTKDVGKGTGLGLSQVYGFVKQSGGHVKIYSEVGRGTTVKVYLPRLVGEDADELTQRGDGAELLLGDPRETVLVVEDEASVREVSVAALETLGYRVLEADGAPAALRQLSAHPEISLLFTDVVMPHVDGRKLADEARHRRPDLRVLFTTGYTRNAVVHNGVLDPGVHLLGKPFTLDELSVKVRQVLDAPS